jgi:hypothetical protein
VFYKVISRTKVTSSIFKKFAHQFISHQSSRHHSVIKINTTEYIACPCSSEVNVELQTTTCLQLVCIHSRTSIRTTKAVTFYLSVTSMSRNANNSTRNIDNARRFLWEDDSATTASSSSRTPPGGQRGFSTRDFAVDQSNNLMDMGREDDNLAANKRRSGSGGGGGRIGDTIAGLFRPSSSNLSIGAGRGEFDEYMDAAPSTDADEYISEKRRRLNPFWMIMATVVDGRRGHHGTKLAICLLVGLGLLGGGLYVIFSSSGDGSSSRGSSVDINGVRYKNIKNRIVETNVTTESLLNPSGATPQHMALAWIVNDDPAQLSFDHPALLDRYSLVTFYFASTNAETGGWKDAHAWLSEQGICAWHGIECVRREQEATVNNNFKPFTSTYNDNDRVTGISLKENDIEGEIPGEWGTALDHLITLDLQDNRLGHVVPTAIGNLVNLRELLLRNNLFYGPLPSEFGALTNLHHLNLAKNDFEGPIPAIWKNMKELRNFDVSSNLLTGSIPDFSQMTRLLGLFMEDNNFEGALPTFLQKFTDLSKFMRSPSQNSSSRSANLLFLTFS